MTTKGILGHGLVETGLVFLPDSGGGHDTGPSPTRPARKAFMELGGRYGRQELPKLRSLDGLRRIWPLSLQCGMVGRWFMKQQYDDWTEDFPVSARSRYGGVSTWAAVAVFIASLAVVFVFLRPTASIQARAHGERKERSTGREFLAETDVQKLPSPRPSRPAGTRSGSGAGMTIGSRSWPRIARRVTSIKW